MDVFKVHDQKLTNKLEKLSKFLNKNLKVLKNAEMLH
jgi:hypothetical protein